uniref:Putative secreted protein n=1 Tax=Anopheles darlingi TaxID=43151 RepID=A0A2M4D3U9_ANODA
MILFRASATGFAFLFSQSAPLFSEEGPAVPKRRAPPFLRTVFVRPAAVPGVGLRSFFPCLMISSRLMFIKSPMALCCSCCSTLGCCFTVRKFQQDAFFANRYDASEWG